LKQGIEKSEQREGKVTKTVKKVGNEKNLWNQQEAKKK
jgi:hypothetical protein